MITTQQNQAMRTITLHKQGDYFNAYGSDAIILAKELGLVRLTVSDRHSTESIPAGTAHTAIGVHMLESATKELSTKEWFIEIQES